MNSRPSSPNAPHYSIKALSSSLSQPSTPFASKAPYFKTNSYLSSPTRHYRTLASVWSWPSAREAVRASISHLSKSVQANSGRSSVHWEEQSWGRACKNAYNERQLREKSASQTSCACPLVNLRFLLSDHLFFMKDINKRFAGLWQESLSSL